MIRPAIFNDRPGISAGFTTRGFAEIEEDVDVSRGRLAEQFGFSAVASTDQVHGNNVVVVRSPGHVPACDGLVTDQPGLLLTVVSADCALVLLGDPEAGVVGACHSGWRGTVAGVTANAINAMGGLGAQSHRIHAYVTPCISAAAFEVGEEVAEHFDTDVVIRKPEWPKPHVDLKAGVFQQLRAAGVVETNIEIDTACTASDIECFYSYRAEGGATGRMIGFIGRHNTGPSAARGDI